MDVINANIKFIRKQKGLTQQGFADAIGIKRSSLGAYEEGRAKPNYATIQTISTKFNISIDRLLTEDLTQTADNSVFGASLPKNTSHNSPKAANSSSTPDIEGNRLRILSITVDDKNKENIELVPNKARAGYLEGYEDPQYIKQLPRFNLPFLNQGTYRAFEIQGDSMLPLQPGSIVVGEYTENWKDIKDNDSYVVVSQNDGIVYKRIKNNIKNNKTLTLRSDNVDYPAYTINIDDVVEVWKAKVFISKESSSAQKMSLEKLTNLVLDVQQNVMKLQSKIIEEDEE